MSSRLHITTPIGRLGIVADDRAIRAIDWEDESAPTDTTGDDSADEDGVVVVAPGEHPVLDRAAAQLGEYFAGERIEFDLPLDPGGTPFQQAAWEALRAIPFGETITYGEQAARLGDKNKSRAVGAANGRNPIPIVVPCHRVVGSNGHLTGFAGGLDTKAWLLDHEFAVRARA